MGIRGREVPSQSLVIELFDEDPATHGPRYCIGVIPDAVRVGWSWYSRYPSKAFFTLHQDSPLNALILPLRTHVRIWYLDAYASYQLNYLPLIVFSGRVVEPDSSGDDVVWSCYNYLSDLSLSRTGYRRLFPNAPLFGSSVTQESPATVVSGVAAVEWLRNAGAAGTPDYKYGAKVQDRSRLAHIATGTFENAVKPGGGSWPVTTDAQFGVIDVSRLLLFFDLTEMSRANTAYNTTFEITRVNPTLNVWADAGYPVNVYRLMFPGNILDYRYVPGYTKLRNDLATVGPSSGATGRKEYVETVDGSIDAFGRMQDVFSVKTFAGYKSKDVDDQASATRKITKRAVTEASKIGKLLQVRLRGFDFPPFFQYELEDTIRVEIKRGRDNLDAYYRIVGVQGTADDGGYSQNLFLQLPTA